MKIQVILIILTITILSCEPQGQKNEIESSEENTTESFNESPQKSNPTNNDSSKINSPIRLTEMDYLNDTIKYPYIQEDSIIGIGIITAEGSNIYEIYNEKGKVIASVEWKENDVITRINNKVYNRHDTLNPLSPRLFSTSPDYFSLAFDCISIDSVNYKVIINRKSERTGFIKRIDKGFRFETIEEFVKNWTGLGFDFDRANNPLRTLPSISSDTIHNELEKKYKIWRGDGKNVKGDWIEVQTTKTENGWIRWRNGNQILIRMYFAC